MPVILPTVVVGSIFGLARSITDFAITLFLVPVGFVLMSIEIYNSTNYSIPQLTSANAVILLAMSLLVVGIGEAGVKICHNLILGVVAQILAETTVLAERGGIARADYLAFINDSVLGSRLQPLQDAGVREPQLHADLHQPPAAQGLRARSRGGPASATSRSR